MIKKRTVEDPKFQQLYVDRWHPDKRRIRRYHRLAAQWWLAQCTLGGEHLASLHMRDMRRI